MRRKRRSRLISLIFSVGLIAVMSFIGISYAYWSEDIKVSAAVSSGNMDVYFLNTKEDLTYGSNVSISYYKDSNVSDSPNNNVMNLNITMKKNQVIGGIRYTTINGGTIPIRPMYYKIPVNPGSKGVGITFSPNYYMFKPGDNGGGTIKITTYDYAQPGKYDFSIILSHKQWINGLEGKWQQNIVVKGTVEVVE